MPDMILTEEQFEEAVLAASRRELLRVKRAADRAIAKARADGIEEGRREVNSYLKAISAFNGTGPKVVHAIDRLMKAEDESDSSPSLPPDLADAYEAAAYDLVIEAKENDADAGPMLAALAGLLDDPEGLAEALSGLDSDTVAKAIGQVVLLKAWDESKHPRAKDGKFISKDAIADAKTDPAKAEELRARVKPEDASKLEDALSGKTDLGRTKKGEAKEGAKQRAASKEDRLARVKAIRFAISRRTHTADDLRELAEHLPHLSIAELRKARGALEQDGASFGGARRRDAMVNALVEHAKRIAAAEDADAIDHLDFGALVDYESTGTPREALSRWQDAPLRAGMEESVERGVEKEERKEYGREEHNKWAEAFEGEQDDYDREEAERVKNLPPHERTQLEQVYQAAGEPQPKRPEPPRRPFNGRDDDGKAKPLTPEQEKEFKQATTEYKKQLKDYPDAAAKWESEHGKEFHRSAVESALAAGKPVPTEVLADYPDLQPKNADSPHPASIPAEMPSMPGYDVLSDLNRDSERKQVLGEKLARTGALLPSEAREYIEGDRALTPDRAVVALTNKLGVSEAEAKKIVAGLKPTGETTVGGKRKRPTYDGADLMRAVGKLYEENSGNSGNAAATSDKTLQEANPGGPDDAGVLQEVRGGPGGQRISELEGGDERSPVPLGDGGLPGVGSEQRESSVSGGSDAGRGQRATPAISDAAAGSARGRGETGVSDAPDLRADRLRTEDDSPQVVSELGSSWRDRLSFNGADLSTARDSWGKMDTNEKGDFARQVGAVYQDAGPDERGEIRQAFLNAVPEAAEDGKAGDTVPFDATLHDSDDPSVRPGDPVQVHEPGLALSGYLKDGGGKLMVARAKVAKSPQVVSELSADPILDAIESQTHLTDADRESFRNRVEKVRGQKHLTEPQKASLLRNLVESAKSSSDIAQANAEKKARGEMPGVAKEAPKKTAAELEATVAKLQKVVDAAGHNALGSDADALESAKRRLREAKEGNSASSVSPPLATRLKDTIEATSDPSAVSDDDVKSLMEEIGKLPVADQIAMAREVTGKGGRTAKQAQQYMLAKLTAVKRGLEAQKV